MSGGNRVRFTKNRCMREWGLRVYAGHPPSPRTQRHCGRRALGHDQADSLTPTVVSSGPAERLAAASACRSRAKSSREQAQSIGGRATSFIDRENGDRIDNAHTCSWLYRTVPMPQ